MPGLVPGIHVFFLNNHREVVDGRDKPGHDDMSTVAIP
jgi:hypothetical protein